MKEYDSQRVENLVEELLGNITGSYQGIEKTPKRVAKMFTETMGGYLLDLKEVANGAIYDSEGSGSIVMAGEIEYNSTCEHHMLPFVGKAYVAYIPDQKIIGLSKIPRIVDMYARRLQIQERITEQVADALENLLRPKGIMVLLTGDHMCATVRGVKQRDMLMKTVATRGVFADNADLRREFYMLVNG